MTTLHTDIELFYINKFVAYDKSNKVKCKCMLIIQGFTDINAMKKRMTNIKKGKNKV